MHLASPTTSASPPATQRRSALLRRLAVGATIVALAGLAVWWLIPKLSWSASEPEPMTHQVQRGEFFQDVSASGSVESASNVEIRCEVQSLKSAGTMILDVVPEGVYVEEGDFLVRLDSSWLENDRTKQEITCATSEAAVTESRNAYETAVIAKQEYLEGQYKLDEQKILSEILVAEEEASRSQENLAYSERLAAKGYITKLQLDAERFAVEKAANELESANLKLHVLQEFTRQKQIKHLESDIATAKAKLDAKVHSHKLDVEQLALIEEQVDNCTIMAPSAGQVVYANVVNRRGSGDILIEPGTLVRERQVIIRLPDPRKMQVSAKINEAKISAVAKGMSATIRLDAFPDIELTGTVEEVSDYPAPTSWTRGDVKEYETIIKINNPPPGLKPGLTAEVRIRVHQLAEALQVPVQAMLEQDMHYYCVLRDGKFWKPREVQVGWSNDKFVVICDVVKLAAPALFDFDGRTFCLAYSSGQWCSRQVKSATIRGDTAQVVGAPGKVTQARATFDHNGQQVQLVFNGQQWAFRSVKLDPESGSLEAADDAVPVPIQAAFQQGEKLYCLDTDYEQWARLLKAEPPREKTAAEKLAAGPHGLAMAHGRKTRPGGPPPGKDGQVDRGSGPRPKPPASSMAPPEKRQPDKLPKRPPAADAPAPPRKEDKPASGDAAPSTALALGFGIQRWDAREVRINSAPDDPQSIGIGLKTGEKVVLNAMAFRGKVALPHAAEDPRTKPPARAGKAKGKPRPQGKSSRQESAAAKTGGPRQKRQGGRSGESP